MTRAVAILLLVLTVACGGHKTRKTLVPDVPTNGSKIAYTRFVDAKAKFLKDGKGGDEFHRIAEDFPEDPIAPWAQLYAGIASVNARKWADAAKVLGEVLQAEVPDALTIRAELYLGIAKNYLGDARAALPLLKKGAAKGFESEAERTEYLAALAYATAAVDPVASLPIFDQLYSRVTAAEKALIVTRCEEVAAGADTGALRKIADDLDKKGPAMAAVATRLALENGSDAAKYQELAKAARHAVGLPAILRAATAVAGAGHAGLVGAVMPGAKNKAGDAAAAGLGLAAGASDGSGVVAVEIRQAADPSAAAVAVEDLAKSNVIAVVGPIDGAAVDAAADRADSLGVPLISLSGRPEKHKPGKFVFHVRHSAEARARVLARYVLGKGVKTFAILAPDDGYGSSVGAAFADEVGKGGGSIATKVTYPSGEKNLLKYTNKLSGSFEALFVPDEAEKLALIAPSLSASGKIPKPLGTKRASGGKPIVLLSTAEGLTGTFIANAQRHAEGAILAPGYYPDDKDPAQKTFLDRFLAAFGRAPGVNEAYAYDAAQLAAAAGTGGRAGLAATLANGTLAGITGAIKFDKDHRRADPGVLYTVIDETDSFAIRAIK